MRAARCSASSALAACGSRFARARHQFPHNQANQQSSMKTLLDFSPIAAFFVGYFFPSPDIYRATIVLMVAMAVQVAALWAWDFRRRSRSSDAKPMLNRMHLISAGLVLVLGAATVLLKNDLIIKWKPTVVDWLFGLVFLGSQLLTGKSLLQRGAGEALTLPDHVWRALNMSWVMFFFVLGALNIVVVYNFSEAVWVNFKLFGSFALTMAFVFGQVIWIRRHLPAEDEPARQESEN
jgi:intracellular septation protein